MTNKEPEKLNLFQLQDELHSANRQIRAMRNCENCALEEEMSEEACEDCMNNDYKFWEFSGP